MKDILCGFLALCLQMWKLKTFSYYLCIYCVYNVIIFRKHYKKKLIKISAKYGRVTQAKIFDYIAPA